MSLSQLGAKELEAHPTKALFVDLLTRDVNLTDAVSELVDNSVDAARRLRPEEPGVDSSMGFSGLSVKLEISATGLSIEDNCGGIPWSVAKHQLFRLGRPADAPPTPGSVGRFGIGLKRSVFKMGRWFKIDTTSESDKYSVTVDVDLWSARDDVDSWTLEADGLPSHPSSGTTFPEAIRGTHITVDRLFPTISSQFGNPSFVREVGNRIRQRQGAAIDKGLRVEVNGTVLVSDRFRLINSSDLRPAWTEASINGAPEEVRFKCIAGVAKPGNSDNSGWYVICNGRTILQADRTSLVGWNEPDQDIPRFHKEYAPFRGYAFFDCKDPDRLPWNTSKTGLNEESEVYQKARPLMLQAMKPVISYLRQAYKSLDAGGPSPVEVLKRYTEQPINEMEAEGEFTFVPPAADNTPATQRITFVVPADKAKQVKEHIGSSAWKDVGEALFNYYVEYEIGGDAS